MHLFRSVASAAQIVCSRRVHGSRCSSLLISIVAAPTFLATAVIAADRSQLDRGQAIARSLCSPCHAIGKSDPSPTRANDETAFRDLHKRFPITMLMKAKKTGEIEGHDEMPGFELSHQAVADLLAYIDSLSPRSSPKYTAR